MGKRKPDDRIETLVDAIRILKRFEEKAFENEMLSDIFHRVEKELHDRLFELMEQKVKM